MTLCLNDERRAGKSTRCHLCQGNLALGLFMTPPLPCSAEDARALFARLQAQARAQGVPLRPPPPEPTTCCGRGCNGCVWEAWYAAVGYWRDDALQALGSNGPQT